MKDTLTIDYEPTIANNGFQSIRETGEAREFVFINEAYVRFASVDKEATSERGYAYKVYPYGDDVTEIRTQSRTNRNVSG